MIKNIVRSCIQIRKYIIRVCPGTRAARLAGDYFVFNFLVLQLFKKLPAAIIVKLLGNYYFSCTQVEYRNNIGDSKRRPIMQVESTSIPVACTQCRQQG